MSTDSSGWTNGFGYGPQIRRLAKSGLEGSKGMIRQLKNGLAATEHTRTLFCFFAIRTGRQE
jgi:hypothetical protein